MNGSLGTMAGLRVIEDRNCYVTHLKQVRFPRSRKVRMRRKWAKDFKNWKTIMTPQAYQWGDTVVAHPLIVAKLRSLA